MFSLLLFYLVLGTTGYFTLHIIPGNMGKVGKNPFSGFCSGISLKMKIFVSRVVRCIRHNISKASTCLFITFNRPYNTMRLLKIRRFFFIIERFFKISRFQFSLFCELLISIISLLKSLHLSK